MGNKTIPPNYQRIIDNAWLGIDVEESTLFNPLDNIPIEYEDEPHMYVLWLMQRPEYFSFLCKEVFGIQLLPVQCMMLTEMWNRRFPMLIASRGFGKSYMLALYSLLRILLLPERRVVICGAAFRQSKVIFNYMESIWYNAPLLRDLCGPNAGPRHEPDMFRFHIGDSTALALPIGDGCVSSCTATTYDDGFGIIGDYKSHNNIVWGNKKFNKIDAACENGVKPVQKIVTHTGLNIIATHNHKFKVVDGINIVWKRIDQIKQSDYILVDRSYRWHNGDFKCTEDQAYGLGLLISDGCRTKDANECLNFWNLKPQCYTKDKTLPSTILSSPRNQMSACIRGLYDSDGHVLTFSAKSGIEVSVNFTNTSKTLVKQIQYILLHYGIVSILKFVDRGEKQNRVYELEICGKNVQLFYNEIGFGLKHKQDMLKSVVGKKKIDMCANDNIPNIKPLLLYIVKNYNGSGFPEVNYSKIDKLKNISFNLVAKFLLKYRDVQHEYIDTIKELADPSIYYDTVKSVEDVGETDTYDLHVPETHEYCASGFFSHNSRIRGQRANDIIADEFAAQSREVFENVIAGFAAVKSSPIDSVRDKAARTWAARFGIDPPDNINVSLNNQIILSGTAYYDFNHFGEYWKRWRSIIRSRGDTKKLQDIFGNDDDGIPEDFDWRDYSIIRLPFELVPKGFMDDAMVARSKATVHSGIYKMEFGAVFSNDSNGFFKRSLIESCVLTNDNEITLPSGKIDFTACLHGKKSCQYVYGIDPASEVDNFSIVILEHYADHRRIVYSWTTNKKEHRERLKKGLVTETEFYSYCSRKIRELMQTFPCARIAMDSQGGGIAVSEALHDLDKINAEAGEVQIWPIIDPKKKQFSDGEPGLHIIEMINFASADWTSEANHGLRKDFEDRSCIFPFFDSISLGLAKIADENGNRLYDTLEDCIMEIEELKDELSTIVISQTPNGRDRWDTPEIKLPGNKKGRLRKDRYSSLVMCNMVSRQMARNPEKYFTTAIGGWAGSASATGDKQAYIGSGWLSRGLSDIYD